MSWTSSAAAGAPHSSVNPPTTKQSSVRWKNRRDEEELDKLLEGLTELTESLPDSVANDYHVNNKVRFDDKDKVELKKTSKSDGDEEVNKSNNGEANCSSRSIAELQRAILSPLKTNNVNDEVDDSDLRGENPNFPSVRKTRQFLSRETYPASASPEQEDLIITEEKSHYKRQPYHTMKDSKPFSYIRAANNQSSSRSMSRASSKEQGGLESPSLIRKVIIDQNGGGGGRESPSFSPPRHEVKVIEQKQRQQETAFSVPIVRPAHESKFDHHPVNAVFSDEEASLTWLEKQQRKLNEKREAERRRENPPQKKFSTSQHFVLNEFRSVKSETTDGYASDLYSETGGDTTTRESSPSTYKYNNTINGHNNNSNNNNNNHVYNIPVKTQDSSSNYGQNGYVSDFGSGYNTYGTYKQQQQYTRHQQQQVQSGYISDNASSFGRTNLSRQRSDTSYDRNYQRPNLVPRRLRYDSESESEIGGVHDIFSSRFNGSQTSLESSATGGGFGGSRPTTPSFSALRNRLLSTGTMRSASPSASSLYNGGRASTPVRRGSSSSEPADVPTVQVKLVKDNRKFWYKPDVSREEAISLLRHQAPGAFVVRDSNSFPGAFGLALKVAAPPANSQSPHNPDELIRHFLIEPTSKGVKLKGYNNEPVFASLSALIYQHSLTQLALPTLLILPRSDPAGSDPADSVDSNSKMSSMQKLLSVGAACNVTYLLSFDTDTLTGPEAVRRAVDLLYTGKRKTLPSPLLVHFKVSSQGITLTDNARKRFFRRHFHTAAISHCGVDPDNRVWASEKRVFAFVARRKSNRSNRCHVFAEHDNEQPARAIVNFVNKVMLSSGNNARADVV